MLAVVALSFLFSIRCFEFSVFHSRLCVSCFAFVVITFLFCILVPAFVIFCFISARNSCTGVGAVASMYAGHLRDTRTDSSFLVPDFLLDYGAYFGL